jgi:thiamine-phosphate pyrophosphorylase
VLIVNDDVAPPRQSARTRASRRARRKRGTGTCQLGDAALIGVSCYDSLERAMSGHAAGADYVAFRELLSVDHHKPDAPARASRPSRRRASASRCSIVAIGGITPANGATLIEAGARALRRRERRILPARRGAAARKLRCRALR